MNIKFLSPYAKMPTRGTEDSAGYDLYAAIDSPYAIPPRSMTKIPTGLAIEVPKGYFGGIFARSGIAIKRGLRPQNCTGVIDTDYRGEVIVALYNDSQEMQCVEPGERIAQLILIPYANEELTLVDELDDTVRGQGGFGSTGTK